MTAEKFFEVAISIAMHPRARQLGVNEWSSDEFCAVLLKLQGEWIGSLSQGLVAEELVCLFEIVKLRWLQKHATADGNRASDHPLEGGVDALESKEATEREIEQDVLQ